MDIHYVFRLPLFDSRTSAEIDADIREELQFHLDMRTEENMRAGMSQDDASRDARQRFGDFETSHRNCRNIALGTRLLLRRLQTGLLVALIGAVVYQAVLLFQLQSTSRDKIESLTSLVEQLRAGQVAVGETAATIPYVHWNDEPGAMIAVDDNDSLFEFADWDSVNDSLRQPWSDWRSLDE